MKYVIITVSVDAPVERETARITITRFFTVDGEDLVQVDSDDLNGGRLGVVEALGLLELAKYDVCNWTDDDRDYDDD